MVFLLLGRMYGYLTGIIFFNFICLVLIIARRFCIGCDILIYFSPVLVHFFLLCFYVTVY